MPLTTSVDPLNSYKSKAEWLRTFFFLGGGVHKFPRPPPSPTSNPRSPSETNIFISQSIHRVKIHLNRLVQTIRMTGNTIQGLYRYSFGHYSFYRALLCDHLFLSARRDDLQKCKNDLVRCTTDVENMYNQTFFAFVFHP